MAYDALHLNDICPYDSPTYATSLIIVDDIWKSVLVEHAGLMVTIAYLGKGFSLYVRMYVLYVHT